MMEYESKIKGGGDKIAYFSTKPDYQKKVKIGGDILRMNFQIPIIRALYVAYEFYSALRGKNLCDCLKLGKTK
jgi:hypothetical protein